MAELPLTCPYCGQNEPNSYQLIYHEEVCEVRWAHKEAMLADRGDERHRHPEHRRATSIAFSWTKTTRIHHHEREVNIHMADLTFRDSDPAETATLAPKDEAGYDVPLSGVPTWSEDSKGAVIALNVAADGMTATAGAVAPGTANVSIQATTSDGTVINGSSVVTVTAGPAASLGVSWAPITPAPAPAPAPAPVPDPNPAPAPAPAPAPTPAPPAQAAALPLYEHTGGPVTAEGWPQASVNAADGTPLYNFVNDVAGGPPNGASAEWVPYTGPTTPVAGA